MTAPLALLAATSAYAEAVVNVYSTHHHRADMQIYERFTEDTGINVDLVQGTNRQLLARINKEGEFSPADLFIAEVAGNPSMWRGLFQPVRSALLNERVPAHLRDSDGYWFGVHKHADVIVVNREEDAPDVSRYEDLADEALRGKVCMGPSKKIYNISLLASLVEHHGEADAERWARGVVANLARPPQDEVALLRAVAAAECAVTSVNTHIVDRLRATEPALTANLRVVYPNQADRGVHVIVVGAGVLRRAPNRDHAVRFLEHLAGDFAQSLLAEGNSKTSVRWSAPVAALGAFNADTFNAAVLRSKGPLTEIFDRVGWRR